MKVFVFCGLLALCSTAFAQSCYQKCIQGGAGQPARQGASQTADQSAGPPCGPGQVEGCAPCNGEGTCAAVLKPPPPGRDCTADCKAACVCKRGTFWNGHKCVTESQCRQPQQPQQQRQPSIVRLIQCAFKCVSEIFLPPSPGPRPSPNQPGGPIKPAPPSSGSGPAQPGGPIISVPPAGCPPKQVWDANYNTCNPRSCWFLKNGSNVRIACKDQPSCVCADPKFYKNDNDDCVAASECQVDPVEQPTQSSCPADQERKDCLSTCDWSNPNTCASLNPPEDQFCNKMCASGCECTDKSLYLNDEGKCVTKDKCPASPCPPDQRIDSCLKFCAWQEPSSCASVIGPPKVGRIGIACTDQCRKGCVCKDSSKKLRSDGKCVSPDECTDTGA